MKKYLPYIVGLALLSYASIAQAAITFVQANSTTSGSSASVTLSTTTQAGGTVVVILGMRNSSHITNVTSSAGDVFTRQIVASSSGSINAGLSIWTATNVATSTAITADVTPNTGVVMDVIEYNGVSSIGTNTSSTSATGGASTTIVTQDANNWVVMGGSTQAGATVTATNGTTIRSNNLGSAFSLMSVGDNNTSTATSLITSWTGGTQYQSAAIELRSTAAASGGSGANQNNMGSGILNVKAGFSVKAGLNVQ